MTVRHLSLFGRSTIETLFLPLAKQKSILEHQNLVKKLHEHVEWVCTVLLLMLTNAMTFLSSKYLRYTAIITLISISLTACQKLSSNVQVQKYKEISTAQMSQTVDLKDGDIYELTAAPVKKIIN